MKKCYTRSSKTKIYNKEENNRFYSDYKYYQLNSEELSGVKHPAALLLDSSLISQTKFKYYTHKIISCGDYYQIYEYPSRTFKKDSNLEKIVKHYNKSSSHLLTTEIIKPTKESLEYRKFYSNPMYSFIKKEDLQCFKIKNKPFIGSSNKIDIKNINRSKFELQRIVKANELEFKSFITLTFEENITSIDEANKIFNSFRTYIKRLKNDFKYVCVPEFQKRGAVHYHLLTNINYTDFCLLSKEEIKLWSPKSKSWQIGRNLLGWNRGYSLAKDINCSNTNIIGYITKYLTKDIDNRLWGKRRYLYSQNLIKPKITYLDLKSLDDFSKYVDIINKCDLNYTSSYTNIYSEKMLFNEYKKKEIISNV